jgi:hypothetical protein
MWLQKELAQNAVDECSKKDSIIWEKIELNSIRTSKLLKDSSIFMEKNIESLDHNYETIPNLKEIYLWEIDNTIRVLEKRLSFLEGQPWYDASQILEHIQYLETKYRIIKDSTDKELKEEWISDKLLNELRYILKTYWK